MQQLVIFDGVCNLCNGTVNFIIKKDKKDKFRFTSLQSEIGQSYLRAIPSKSDSIFYIRNKQVLTKSTAALFIAKDLGFPYSLLTIFRFLPTTWRDNCYDYIARNRYRWFGKRETCEVPSEQIRKKFI
ncbi:DCC1-like thiol-disulfide oxidoreductase family protein [Sphingobacterium sp. SRCM116780]|uniref:thiol-disulfide oxidoreductase DCC family protein n=1 Tax=Sphingobacterium sp. SRCM116780 TaxID=2907623 RepID=UPI001F447156|nr:DCC1-like thiol-disulfide oxidoreductase family protein [Sphingobacterium sp. SRCM116780]UIR55018.1 DCC1-like thiol-disulfide oxidoreductase family protein [Sphingobacterium sp. SRCM116780]